MMKEIGMKLGIISVVFIVFMFSYIAIDQTTYEKKHEAKQTEKEIVDEPVMVSVSIDDTVNTIELDSYLLGVVAGEMPASFELEALKAQVVASRTFVFQRGLTVDNTTSTQVYLSEEQMKTNWADQFEEKKNKIEQAIQETKGEVLMYEGDYISALFFSSAAGYTENSEDYFEGGALPYLRSVESPWDETVDTNYKRTKNFTKSELQAAFECTKLDFNITAYKASGRVETLVVDGKEYTGRQVRELLGLSSSNFTIEVNGDTYTFTSVGSGHGVGMSQYGAQGMAKAGYTYQEILQHYYTNVEIVNK